MKERLKYFLTENDLSAKQFSEKIGVQASSISHILTGRNKPSVELLQKILKSYSDFDIYWLLTGKKENKEHEVTDSNLKSDKPKQSDSTSVENSPGELLSVLCLYKDGSFEKFGHRS